MADRFLDVRIEEEAYDALERLCILKDAFNGTNRMKVNPEVEMVEMLQRVLGNTLTLVEKEGQEIKVKHRLGTVQYDLLG